MVAVREREEGEGERRETREGDVVSLVYARVRARARVCVRVCMCVCARVCVCLRMLGVYDCFYQPVAVTLDCVFSHLLSLLFIVHRRE